jgi:hypothetical protein
MEPGAQPLHHRHAEPLLGPFLPRNTSLTRLGVPRIWAMSARVKPCWSNQVVNQIGNARRPPGPFALLVGSYQTGLRLQARNIVRSI